MLKIYKFHKSLKNLKHKKYFCLLDTNLPQDNNKINNMIHNVDNKDLTTSQKEILNMVKSQKQVTLILADDYSKGRYANLSGLVNRIKSKPDFVDAKEFSINEDDIFVNYNTVYETMKKNYNKNKLKISIKPRGALLIGKKLDFLTKSYKILKEIDKEASLRITRIGNSLQGVTFSVENVVFI
jgi:hypothetical protein